MKELGETVYTTPFTPDPTSALDVLAFLLVSPELFINEHDVAETRAAVVDLLDNAKRDALLTWYKHYLRSKR